MEKCKRYLVVIKMFKWFIKVSGLEQTDILTLFIQEALLKLKLNNISTLNIKLYT